MKILFITNILAKHQTGLWDNFVNFDDVNFTYLTTNDDKSIFTGYKENERSYTKKSSDFSEEELKQFINQQDYIVVGSIDDPRVLNIIKKKDNLIWAYEHFSKKRSFANYGIIVIARAITFPYRMRRLVRNNTSKNNYLLCLSSNVGKDWRLGSFPKDKIFKFGYFPTLNYAQDDELKSKDLKSVLWVGRFVDFKHPEKALEFFNTFNKYTNGYSMTLIGDGDLAPKCKKIAKEKMGNLPISFLGEIEGKLVQNHMMKASIFIFPSDYGEGWGNVLGEAMASGCIVFANVRAGSTTYLVKNGINGFTYRTKRELKERIKQFLNLSPEQIYSMRKNAVMTMKNEWSGSEAATRLHSFLKNISNGEVTTIFKDGVLSKYD